MLSTLLPESSASLDAIETQEVLRPSGDDKSGMRPSSTEIRTSPLTLLELFEQNQRLVLQNQQLLIQNQQVLLQNQQLLAQLVAVTNSSKQPVVAKKVSSAPPSTQEKRISMNEVTLHNSATSCYTVIRDTVYDVTSFIPKHPGGASKIERMCGKDGTQSFVNQHGGSSDPEQVLATFKVAPLAK
jgi:cytochrome b involved in lipid metabolism